MTSPAIQHRRRSFAHRLTRASLALTLGLSVGVIVGQELGPLSEARRALEAGRPYLATKLLAPVIADAPQDSGAVLLAARAAAGWEAWGSTVRLLSGQPWLDRLEDGAGRALLARARVERSEEALPDARAAAGAGSATDRGARLVTLARAYDRAGLLDSASRAYQAAAEAMPEAASWLRLRAAGVERDSARRAELLARVELAAARSRIPWTEALARDRTGDAAGAAELYDDLGATLTSLRIRLRLATEPDSLAEVKRALLGMLSPRRTAEDARGAIALLDARFAPLGRADELVVSRRSYAVDRFERAAQGFARAARQAPLGPDDRYLYGLALNRLRR